MSASFLFDGPADDTGEDKDRKKKKDGELSFRELLAIVYGCDPADCTYRLPRLHGSGDAWLERFSKAENCAVPTGPQSHLVTGAPIANIKIRQNEVAGAVHADKTPRDNLLTALAMATCAKAHKNMRKQGARISGSSPQEQMYLLIAAEYIGLKVTGVDPALKKQMAQFKAHINADDIFREYVDIMNGNAPASPVNDNDPAQDQQPAGPQTGPNDEAEEAQEAQETTPPPESEQPEQPEQREGLTQIFNREIGADAKPYLAASDVDEDTYKALSEAIIRDQDARGKTVKERYKDKFNLTGNQIQNILKAMDAEGLTSSRPGKARAVNYNSDGLPKNAAPPGP